MDERDPEVDVCIFYPLHTASDLACPQCEAYKVEVGMNFLVDAQGLLKEIFRVDSQAESRPATPILRLEFLRLEPWTPSMNGLAVNWLDVPF